jgi:hypothetical protein
MIQVVLALLRLALLLPQRTRGGLGEPRDAGRQGHEQAVFPAGWRRAAPAAWGTCMPLVRAATIGVACIASAVVVGSRLAMATREGGAVAGPGDRGAVRAGGGAAGVVCGVEQGGGGGVVDGAVGVGDGQGGVGCGGHGALQAV